MPTDILPIWCPACDKAGTPAKMVKEIHTRAEGMMVKCLGPSTHRYSYDRLMQLNPRKEQLPLVEKQPPNTVVINVWCYPEALEALKQKFPSNLMTTLCATLAALADPDVVLIEGEHAREMVQLGVKRGRDVLGLARQVKTLQTQLDEARIRERALEPLLKALGGMAGVQQATPQAEPTATVDGHRNPDLPAPAALENLVESDEGFLVPAQQYASGEVRPPFVVRTVK